MRRSSAQVVDGLAVYGAYVKAAVNARAIGVGVGASGVVNGGAVTIAPSYAVPASCN